MAVVDSINRQTRRVPAWLIYVLMPIPAVWTFYQGLTDALGPEPIKALEHALGEWALWLLIAGLAVTPLRRHLGLNLLRFRRAIGVMTFVYVGLHLLTWLVLDVQIASQIVADILKRPYITIGMAAFLLMIPLAVTSNNLSIRKLGPKWRKLHKLTYGVAVLGAIHFVMVAKGFQLEPLIYLGIIVGLLALRIQRPSVFRLQRG